MNMLGLLLGLTIGCSKPNNDTGDTTSISGPVHTIWSGWNHTWGMLSHRVSLIEVRTGEAGQARSGILGGDWSTGDTWSDDVEHRIHQQHVTGAEITVETGTITFTVGPDGGTSTAPLDMLDPDTVVLQGFTINTDVAQASDYPTDYDPALGYTSRGFGMHLRYLPALGVVEGEADVRWGPRDRGDMNRALEVAQTEVTIHFAAVKTAAGVKRAQYTGSQDLLHDPPNSDQRALTEPLNWSGFGVSGIESFALLLDDTDGGSGGDYLRSFGVEMTPDDAGEAPTAVSTEILTSSALELGTMSMTAEADLVWMPLDPTQSRIEGETVAGSHPVGSHTVPL